MYHNLRMRIYRLMFVRIWGIFSDSSCLKLHKYICPTKHLIADNIVCFCVLICRHIDPETDCHERDEAGVVGVGNGPIRAHG